MKSILGAFALVIAAPAVAQGAPAADPHAGHAQHQGHGSESHSGHGEHGEHKMDCCKDCCDKTKRQEKSADAPADHSQHDR